MLFPDSPMPAGKPQITPLAIRRTVYYTGNVQGIGFRHTACHIAREYRVAGFVKNLLDGRVEIVVEGLPEEIEQFIVRVEKTMQRHIEYTTSTDSTAMGLFTSFDIEY